MKHYTVIAASIQLGIAERTLQKRILKGDVAAIREGGGYLIPEDQMPWLRDCFGLNPDLVKLPDAADLLGYTPNGLRQLARRIGIPLEQRGRYLFLTRHTIDTIKAGAFAA